jgi:hypothetical protein
VLASLLSSVSRAQTAENDEPPEGGGATGLRHLRRRTLPPGAAGGLTYTVLGLGDSNLLLDRQTTTAKVLQARRDIRVEGGRKTRKHEHEAAIDATTIAKEELDGDKYSEDESRGKKKARSKESDGERQR